MTAFLVFVGVWVLLSICITPLVVIALRRGRR